MEIKDEVWQKGIIDTKYDSSLIRKDACGAWIVYDHYGRKDSSFGWEIDHIVPQSYLREKGASEDEINNIDNLRPLNWRNNESKDKDYPTYVSSVRAVEDRNEEITDSMTVNNEVQEKLHTLYKKYGV